MLRPSVCRAYVEATGYNPWISSDPDERADAADVCNTRCNQRSACLAEGAATGDVYTVRGGVV